MNKVYAIVGMCGAGKSIVSDFFVDKGCKYLRFGQITLDEVKKRGLEVSEPLEKEIREGFRKEHGMAAFAILNQPKIDALLKEGNVVADGLYSWSEYKVLKEKYGSQLIIIAVYAAPRIRYERLSKRTLGENDTDLRNRTIPPVQAKKRDYAEIENIEKGGPIAMADYLLHNNCELELLNNQLDMLWSELN